MRTTNQCHTTSEPTWPMIRPPTSSTDMPCTCTRIVQCVRCARGHEWGAKTSLHFCSTRCTQMFAGPARYPRREGCRRARCRRIRARPSLLPCPSRRKEPGFLHTSAADHQRRISCAALSLREIWRAPPCLCGKHGALRRADQLTSACAREQRPLGASSTSPTPARSSC